LPGEIGPGARCQSKKTRYRRNGSLNDISESGGIINAYEAAKVAATLDPSGKALPEKNVTETNAEE
jgi:hypothetical protein